MDLIYPHKPLELYQRDLPSFEAESKEWEATLKEDGWRCFVAKDKKHQIADPSWAKDGDLFFLSRRDQKKGGPTQIPVSDEIVETIKALDLPDQSMLDTEWMNRRTIGEINECLFILDTLWLDDIWKGDDTYASRKKTLLDTLPFSVTQEEFGTAYFINEFVRTPIRICDQFAKFYEWGQQFAHAEGIVLKHLESKIVGSREKCQKSGLWVRIKWRSGDDGREEVKF